ncbi:MAG: DUF669 domain-containing protein [Lachnospiraceae bacterium]|nr:DUF669 domain-containing protein [Lachnospiraceae bacterium]
MSNFFDNFKAFLTDDFYKQVEEAEKLNEEFYNKKVSDGIYRIEIMDMAVKQSKRGNWMIQVGYKILNGKYENSVLWSFFVIRQSNILVNNAFLKSLGTSIPIECTSITQYQKLVDDIFITIRGDKEYDAELTTSFNGFTSIKIIKSYDIEKEELPFV